MYYMHVFSTHTCICIYTKDPHFVTGVDKIVVRITYFIAHLRYITFVRQEKTCGLYDEIATMIFLFESNR